MVDHLGPGRQSPNQWSSTSDEEVLKAEQGQAGTGAVDHGVAMVEPAGEHDSPVERHRYSQHGTDPHEPSR